MEKDRKETEVSADERQERLSALMNVGQALDDWLARHDVDVEAVVEEFKQARKQRSLLPPA